MNYRNDLFYNVLFDVLTYQKINYPFKLSLSQNGMPYISILNHINNYILSVVRTLTQQPSLIYILGRNHINYDKSEDIMMLGKKIGVFFDNKLKQSDNKHKLPILTCNITQLFNGYDRNRSLERMCLKMIAGQFMNTNDYYKMTTL